MERTIYTIERYSKELNRKLKRNAIYNYELGSLPGYEDSFEVLARFEHLDDAKKAFAECYSTYGCVGENLVIKEIYLVSQLVDEDGDFKLAPFDNFSLKEYHCNRLKNKYYLPECFMTVTAENGGDMFGDDECFEGNNFYQYVVTSNGIYKAYYDVDNDTIIEDLDYSKATRIELVEKF